MFQVKLLRLKFFACSRRCLSVRAISNPADRGSYVLLSIPLAAFCLGTWQVKRLAWKKELIRDLKARTVCEPVQLPADILADGRIEEMEYKRVVVRGKFDHANEIILGPRSKTTKLNNNGSLISGQSETGYHIITPFVMNDGRRILVNRGWVPGNKKSANSRMSGQIDVEMDITGLVRKCEKRPRYTPRVPEGSVMWHYCDTESFAKLLHTSPILIDADAGTTVEGGPIGGQTRLHVRNEHLQYIITWYSLCAATLVLFYQFRKKAGAVYAR